MINIGRNKILYEVKEYKMVTEDNKLFSIQVLKDATGENPNKYKAIPTIDLSFRKIKEGVEGSGDSEEQALQDCIDKISGKDVSEIWE